MLNRYGIAGSFVFSHPGCQRRLTNMKVVPDGKGCSLVPWNIKSAARRRRVLLPDISMQVLFEKSVVKAILERNYDKLEKLSLKNRSFAESGNFNVLENGRPATKRSLVTPADFLRSCDDAGIVFRIDEEITACLSCLNGSALTLLDQFKAALQAELSEIEDESHLDALVGWDRKLQRLRDLAQKRIKQTLDIDAPNSTVSFQLIRPTHKTKDGSIKTYSYLKAQWHDGHKVRAKSIRPATELDLQLLLPDSE